MQAGKSFGTASAIGFLGQQVFDEPRPNGRDNKSFPSNHASNAFAAATHLHIRYGWQYGFPAFAVAGLVGYGRVKSLENSWKDVVVGGLIGSASAWLFTESKDRHVELLPWASANEFGINIAYSW